MHVADAPSGIATHVPLAASAAGDLSAFFAGLTERLTDHPADTSGAPAVRNAADPDWAPGLAEAVRAALALDGPLLASDTEPVHPSRIYGELLKVLGRNQAEKLQCPLEFVTIALLRHVCHTAIDCCCGARPAARRRQTVALRFGWRTAQGRLPGRPARRGTRRSGTQPGWAAAGPGGGHCRG